MNRKLFLVFTSILMAAGFLGTVFSVICMTSGEKSAAVVSAITKNTKNIVVTYEYVHDNQTYQKDKRYKRSKKISSGKKNTVYFLKKSPEKAYDFNDFAVFYFLLVSGTPMTLFLIRTGKN